MHSMKDPLEDLPCGPDEVWLSCCSAVTDESLIRNGAFRTFSGAVRSTAADLDATGAFSSVSTHYRLPGDVCATNPLAALAAWFLDSYVERDREGRVVRVTWGGGEEILTISRVTICD